MTHEVSLLAQEILGSITDAAVTSALRQREDPQLSPGITGLEASVLPPYRRDAISDLSYDFVVRWETGGRAYYERVIGGKPIWPGYSSGITIGCGYDLGYHTLAEFQADWRSRIGGAAFERLARAIGFKTAEPGREAKIATARAFVSSLADIVVPWGDAIEHFNNSKLPELIGDLYRALDQLEILHPHCRGALLSLVFNRGPAFSAEGARYAEMRAIGSAMRDGSPAAIAGIPAQLRSMQRIWGLSSSLSERREGEAKLFEAGLAEMGIGREAAGFVRGGAPEAVAWLVEDHDDVLAAQSDEAEEGHAGALEAGGGLEGVRWNAIDDDQPDYRHLDTRLAGQGAEILPEDLDALISANAFALKPGKVIFGLRGAQLAGADRRENVEGFTIVDQRPDHRTFRCIIGVYDPVARRLWAYQASTVPNAEYVLTCQQDFKSGKPVGSLTGNILPTGCYTMTVGTHKRGQPGEIPAVLRLSTSADGASSVVVLRSVEDTCYDRRDLFVVATPGDNVHPAQRNQGFSSAGCLTLPGFFRDGAHSGAWQAFRRAAGFNEQTVGQQFSMVLLTGLDAVAATRARAAGEALPPRLRHGSKGAAVARLQSALGLAPDASQLVGPVTRAALVKAQQAKLGWADGIYAPEMDALLGLSVFAGQEAAAPGPEAAAAPDPFAPLLEALRAAVKPGSVVDPVRFTAMFDGVPPADAVLAGVASTRLGFPLSAGPLFAPDPALDRFRLLEVPGLERPDRADLFELAMILRQALGAVTVEPDLGTDYFAAADAPAPGEPRAESSDLAFWCWADDKKDKPLNPDWALASSFVREAWVVARNAGRPGQGEGVLIFQPDTGVVSAHAEVPPGAARDPLAANLVEGGSVAEDPMQGGGNPGHGTGTGSVAASPATGRMSGSAPRVRLVPVRCIRTVALFDQSNVARAIDHARVKGAHVITMSLGGVPSEALHAALRRAVQDNVVVVAAAGNCVEEVVWPARYAEAIAIGGINEAMRPWRGSSHGPAVSICGPAEFVLRADAKDKAEPLAAVSGGQGTSFATALIAGVAALWLAYHGRDRLIGLLPPGRRLQEMLRNLMALTASVPSGHDTTEYGAGVIQAEALLRQDPRTAFRPGAPEAAMAAEAPQASLVSLVSRVYGPAGQEAVAPVLLQDRQHAAEIACAALDRARQLGTRRAFLESLPPPDLSPTLRRRLGPAATILR